MQQIFQSFYCIIFCINFTLWIHNEPSSKFANEHTFYSTDLGELRTNMNSEAKEHWIRKGSSTCNYKDLSFEESAVLVPLSTGTGFVIQRPKGKSTVFIASYLEHVKIVL